MALIRLEKKFCKIAVWRIPNHIPVTFCEQRTTAAITSRATIKNSV